MSAGGSRIVCGPAVLVCDASAFYIARMIGRPCKPDPDMAWLWRTVLPDTPLPACNLSKETVATPASEDRNLRAAAQHPRSWLRKKFLIAMGERRKAGAYRAPM
jgi:hypothetical protein